ncbi:hypothetical protein A6F68_02239 [Tsuneonella dongtanensis]|uniref:Uncharacterized protein n=1 Tax=Tsuneonella dongtanensis TaxID=692370 RepID=A0A1B2AF08_9SPHN|nr:hypothetical protein [Tsuneonella dongtanensis]ANY20739.1 hypothetical protein A6F68_02239 [Tsuneonella dongtanensis]
MSDWKSPEAGRTLGLIFLLIGVFLFGLAAWQKFGLGEETRLFAPAAMICAAAAIILGQSKRRSDNAR